MEGEGGRSCLNGSLARELVSLWPTEVNCLVDLVLVEEV